MRLIFFALFFLLSLRGVSNATDFSLELPVNPQCKDLSNDIEKVDTSGCTAIKKDQYAKGKFNKPNTSILEKYNQEPKDIKFLTYHHTALALYKKVGGRNVVDEKTTKKLISSRPFKIGIGKQVKNIQSGHIKNSSPIHNKGGPKVNWGDIAYHFAVDRFGNIVEGRSLKHRPASGTVYKGGTKGHFTVVIIGNYNHEPLNEQGMLAIIRVLSAGQRKFSIPTSNIKGHREHASTSCPGKYIYERRFEIQKRTLAYSIQKELDIRGCNPGKLDGRFGKNSEAAINRLKEAHPNWLITENNDSALFELLKFPSRSCI